MRSFLFLFLELAKFKLRVSTEGEGGLGLASYVPCLGSCGVCRSDYVSGGCRAIIRNRAVNSPTRRSRVLQFVQSLNYICFLESGAVVLDNARVGT